MNAKLFFQLFVTMILIVATMLPQSANAQAPQAKSVDALVGSEQKITAPDGQADDLFGYSVAFSGSTALVGAYGGDIGSNLDQGSAYVFVRDGATWIMQQKLTAPDGEAGDGFGISVAVSGDTAIVGAYHDHVGTNTGQGSAYVFTRSGTTWAFQQKLTASDGAMEDYFGQKVALSGDTALVGALHDDVGTNIDQGSAYVFTRSGTNWSEQQQLTAPDGEASDNFAISIALSDDIALLGAYHDTVNGISQQGSAYVFTRSGTTWSLQQKLVASDGEWDDYFGISVALSGGTALVGAYGDDTNAINQGSAYVFTRSGTTWYEQQKLAVPGADYDNFGISVALSGDTALVASYGDDISATDQGSAYVFKHSGTIWTQQQRLIASDGDERDLFGVSVALSGNEALVGAFYDTIGTNYRQGSVYFYMNINDILYVKPGGLTSGPCDSWGSACNLQYALTSAAAGQEIWVAAGVYKPTTDPTDRTATFQLKSGVGLYGGFASTETARDQRNWNSNKTVLSGDIDNNDINTDGNFIAESSENIQGQNSYHVVNGNSVDDATVLDGFIITAGQADVKDTINGSGGGMYTDSGFFSTIRNVIFSGNSAYNGGGVSNSYRTPNMTDVTFIGNSAYYGGGGMESTGNSYGVLTNVVFINNTAVGGGGLYLRSNFDSGLTLKNVLFIANKATNIGGGITIIDGDLVLLNVTFFANSAGISGSGIGNYCSNPKLVNSILWDDIPDGGSEIFVASCYPNSTTVSYSDVQGGWPGTGNINADPLFIDPTNGDLHLRAGSPGIDAGTNTDCPSTDFDGISRPKGSRCDMGAYESKWTSFVDVPVTHPYWMDVQILYANGLTAGCLASPLKYCPDQIMNRGAAAVFMLRGNFGSSYVPPVPAHIFKDDWTKGTWAEPWAEGMYYEGLSAGCLASPLKYCPWSQIPREQAVIFALRMKYGMLYTPPPATGTMFTDMTNPNYYATAWAEQAYTDGLIPNCGTSGGKPKFCPKDLVSRGLAAYMIVRAKNLTMP